MHCWIDWQLPSKTWQPASSYFYAAICKSLSWHLPPYSVVHPKTAIQTSTHIWTPYANPKVLRLIETRHHLCISSRRRHWWQIPRRSCERNKARLSVCVAAAAELSFERIRSQIGTHYPDSCPKGNSSQLWVAIAASWFFDGRTRWQFWFRNLSVRVERTLSSFAAPWTWLPQVLHKTLQPYCCSNRAHLIWQWR